MERLDLSLEGFWRSFSAIFIIVPFAALASLSQARLPSGEGEGAATLTAGAAVVQGFGLLVDWLAFPLLFAVLARTLGLTGRYVPFIVARNWAAVLIAAMVATIHALHLLGLLPAQFLSLLLLVAIGVALRFSYVVARTALGAPGTVVLPIVAFDFLLSLTIWAAVDRIAPIQ